MHLLTGAREIALTGTGVRLDRELSISDLDPRTAAALNTCIRTSLRILHTSGDTVYCCSARCTSIMRLPMYYRARISCERHIVTYRGQKPGVAELNSTCICILARDAGETTGGRKDLINARQYHAMMVCRFSSNAILTPIIAHFVFAHRVLLRGVSHPSFTYTYPSIHYLFIYLPTYLLTHCPSIPIYQPLRCVIYLRKAL